MNEFNTLVTAFETYIKSLVPPPSVNQDQIESTVANAVEVALENYDPTEHESFEDGVLGLLEGRIASEVESAVENYDMEGAVNECIDNIDFDEKVNDVLDNHDFAEEDHEHEELSHEQSEEVKNLILNLAGFNPDQFMDALKTNETFRTDFSYWLNTNIDVTVNVKFS